jgi:hypothetical protein
MMVKPDWMEKAYTLRVFKTGLIPKNKQQRSPFGDQKQEQEQVRSPFGDQKQEQEQLGAAMSNQSGY